MKILYTLINISQSLEEDSNFWWIVVAIIVISFLIYWYIVHRRDDNQTMVISKPQTASRHTNAYDVKNRLLKIEKRDPNFSKIVFLDFANVLYQKYYASFSKTDSQLDAFFRSDFISQAQKASYQIDDIIVSNIFVTDVKFFDNKEVIIVEIDSNYTKKHKFNQKEFSTRCDLIERWVFERSDDSLSPESLGFGMLIYPKNQGDSNWKVSQIIVVSATSFDSNEMLTYITQEGTSTPTLFAGRKLDMQNKFINHFAGDYSSFEDFNEKIVKPYFLEIYKNWTNQTWNNVRYLMTDRLYFSHKYWIDAYKENSIKNYLDDIVVFKIDNSEYDCDSQYERVVVRLYASCFDYAMDKKQRIIAGDHKHRREFSEYWTFVARKGKNIKTIADFTKCPSCGNSVDNIGQSGICNYCATKISNAEYSWVLFSITQDEVYCG